MSRRRFPAFCLAATALGALALGACDPLASENEIQSTHTYEVSQTVARLVMQNSARHVLLTNSSTNTGISVTERWTYSGSPPTSTHDVANGALTLTYSCPDSSDCGIDYTVNVPTSVSSQVTDSAGDASPHVKLNDTAGDITIGFSAAPTLVNAQEPGSKHVIQAENTAGDVTVRAN